MAFLDDPGVRLCNVGSGAGPRALLDYRAGRSADVACNILDAGRLRRATGWNPRIGWQDGLAGTAAWLSEATSRSGS